MSVDGRGKALMAAVEEHDLEGIVAKRKRDPYRRGIQWWKIKNPAYSQADDGRGELLNGDRRAMPVDISLVSTRTCNIDTDQDHRFAAHANFRSC